MGTTVSSCVCVAMFWLSVFLFSCRCCFYHPYCSLFIRHTHSLTINRRRVVLSSFSFSFSFSSPLLMPLFFLSLSLSFCNRNRKRLLSSSDVVDDDGDSAGSAVASGQLGRRRRRRSSIELPLLGRPNRVLTHLLQQQQQQQLRRSTLFAYELIEFRAPAAEWE